MAVKHILPPTLEIILEIYCPLPPQQYTVSTSSEMQPCSSSLPGADAESLGNEHIENILSKHWQIARKKIDGSFRSQNDSTTCREIIRSAGKFFWDEYSFWEQRARWCPSKSV